MVVATCSYRGQQQGPIVFNGCQEETPPNKVKGVGSKKKGYA